MAAAPTAVATATPTPTRKSGRSSAALTKAREAAAKATKRARETAAKYKGTRPVKLGRAAVAGAVAGGIHSMVALSVGGRSVPLALPLGIAGAVFTAPGDMLNDVAVDMVAAGSALLVVDEWKRMGWAKR